MHEYVITNLNTGERLSSHASSPRVALNRVANKILDQWGTPGSDGEQLYNFCIANKGAVKMLENVSWNDVETVVTDRA